MTFVHAMAQVDCNVTLGVGCKVWQFASVIRSAVLGEDCNIASCAIVDGARLGNGCLVGHGASVHPGANVGADVFIGPGAVLANDRWPSVYKTGFDAEAIRAGDRFTVIVEPGATIGCNAVVLPGVWIGADAFIAAHATVTENVPPGMVWMRDGALKPKPVDWQARRLRWAA